MTNTLVSTQTEPAVDDFLIHFGIKGMHWGTRKDRSSGVRTSRAQSVSPVMGTASSQTYTQRRAATGQARIDHYDGSTKRAILHLAGTQIAGAILTQSAHIAIKKIPSPAVSKGLNVAIDLGYAALTYRNINEGFKVAQAFSAQKKRKGR